MAGKENVPATRSRGSGYDPDKQCLLCGEATAVTNPQHAKKTGGVVKVQSLQVKASLQVQASRREDDWGKEVTCRLATILDAKSAMRVKYHRNCYKSFYSSQHDQPLSPHNASAMSISPSTPSPSPPQAQRRRLSPSSSSTPLRVPRASHSGTWTTPQAPGLFHQPVGLPLGRGRGRGARGGRNVDPSKLAAFEQVCTHLDMNRGTQFNVEDLTEMLRIYNPQTQYSEQSLRDKLRDRYGDEIVFSTTAKRKSVLTFAQRAQQILSEKYESSTAKNNESKITDAAAIIRREVADMDYPCDCYPSVREIQDGGKSMIPNLLQLLLSEIVLAGKRGGAENYERKCHAIAHNIIAAARPRSFVSPIHLGLSVHVHRSTGSRELVDVLHSLGFCSSYNETMRFEDTVVFSSPPRIDPDAFIQFSFDNFDFNIHTLDGLNTWHCMGGIQCVTPASAVGVDPVLPRTGSIHTAEERGKMGSIPLQYCNYTKSKGLKTVLIPELSEDFNSLAATVHDARCTDYLWMVGSILKDEPTPGWSGFMELITNGLPFERAAVLPLPFINLDPNNPNSLFTSLEFAANEALKHGMKHVFVTYDQPLFWKAADIILQSDANSILRIIILRLGGFHFLLSFLAALGYILSGSGLETMLELVYAKNTVAQIMAGRDYARTIRAHYLAQVVVVRHVLDTFQQYFDEKGVDRVEILKAFELQIQMDEPCASTKKVIENFLLAFDSLSEEVAIGRTGKLWLLYVRLVDFVHLFIRSERSADWDLNVAAVKLMLPVFPATGHLNYAKSVPLYLHYVASMQESLDQSEHTAFATNAAIRRSPKYFVGLSSDLVIEQSLMAALKSQGGLTRGRGLTASNAATFVRAMPLCSRISSALKMFTNCESAESSEHTDLRDSMKRRNRNDIGKMYEWFRAHSPFSKPVDRLVSLSTGLAGDEKINCDAVLEVGHRLVKEMAGKSFGEVSLRRKDRVLPLAAMNSSITANNCVEPVSETLLFHRMVVLNLSDEELAGFFQYELAPRPTSLFDDIGLRKGNKAALIKALDQLSPPSNSVPNCPSFVIDGGHLLHLVVWPRPATFAEICDAYVSYVCSLQRRHNGTATVVFDGYAGGPTTKDPEHLRRTLRTSADVVFGEATVTTTSQALFLANSSNKERLISLLMTRLRAAGIDVYQAEGDADRDVVVQAIHLAEEGKNAVIVGEDTDLIVLMTSLTPRDLSIHIMSSIRGNTVIRSSKAIQEALGPAFDLLLFVHAMKGCDTTSALYKRSVKNALLKLTKSSLLQDIVRVFNTSNATQDNIAAAGERFLLELYGYSNVANLNQARYYMYKKIVARQPVHGKFDIASLPPTSNAARFHSLRVYHQVQAWKGNELPPTQWGWKIEVDRLYPIMATQDPAPAKLLKLILCNCKGDCANNNCECRRSGLRCSSICGHCCGTSCKNAAETIEAVEGEHEEAEAVDDPETILGEWAY